MSEAGRIYKYQPLMNSLYKTAKKKLGFGPDVSIVVVNDDSNANNPLGKTAYYSPGEHKIALYTKGRHIKDILRSLSHELVHHNQNCRGDFDGGAATVEGYAQEDEHLREMEREAYECGNMIFRDWEDNLKSKGAKPLFTSTHYAPPMTTSVVGGRLVEGEKMKNKITESRLREIIKGVIQEMFNDDLVEDADPVSALVKNKGTEAEERAAQTSGSGKDPYEAGVNLEESEEIEEAQEEVVEEQEELEENKEEIEEAKEELEENKEELEEDNDVTEDVNESYFPQDHDIRTKARNELNEALMKRWIKIIK